MIKILLGALVLSVALFILHHIGIITHNLLCHCGIQAPIPISILIGLATLVGVLFGGGFVLMVCHKIGETILEDR